MSTILPNRSSLRHEDPCRLKLPPMILGEMFSFLALKQVEFSVAVIQMAREYVELMVSMGLDLGDG